MRQRSNRGELWTSDLATRQEVGLQVYLAFFLISPNRFAPRKNKSRVVNVRLAVLFVLCGFGNRGPIRCPEVPVALLLGQSHFPFSALGIRQFPSNDFTPAPQIDDLFKTAAWRTSCWNDLMLCGWGSQKSELKNFQRLLTNFGRVIAVGSKSAAFGDSWGPARRNLFRCFRLSLF